MFLSLKIISYICVFGERKNVYMCVCRRENTMKQFRGSVLSLCICVCECAHTCICVKQKENKNARKCVICVRSVVRVVNSENSVRKFHIKFSTQIK